MYETNENKIVALLAETTARKCGLYPAVAKRLRVAAALHDIGKISIPQCILDKPGKLTGQEFEIIKTHTTNGAAILANIQGELGVMARTICANHHEWYSGGGYWGKYSDDLPPYVAMVEIADVFTALCSVRSYKTAFPPEEAVEYIRKQSGTQFSPALAETFIALVRHDESVKVLFTKNNDERSILA